MFYLILTDPSMEPGTSKMINRSINQVVSTEDKKRKMVPNVENNKRMNMNSYVIKTSSSQKSAFDMQIARYVYATNSAFQSVEHVEFKKMVSMLHPGYVPPSRFDVAGKLLENVYIEEKEKCSKILEGQVVCMSLDGWSNVSNEPIICASVTSASGEIFLVQSIDTSGFSHTAEYLTELAKEIVFNCEHNFNCSVRSFVTDNAKNVKGMRQELDKDNQLDLLTYGCSAHLLNLLAQDLKTDDVKEHIVYIVKYFRNNHFANSKYKQEGGLKLVLPCDVRWNTMVDCLTNYIKNWSVLLKICEEHREKIDNIVYNKVVNIGLKRNAENLLKRLEPIAVALDCIQKNTCTIAEAVHIWKTLEIKLKDVDNNKSNLTAFNQRYQQAMGAFHFLAYQVDPRFCGKNLTDLERKESFAFANEKYSPEFISVLMKFLGKSDPFYEFLFSEDVLSKISPLDWWKSHFFSSKNEKIDHMNQAFSQLLTARASTASIERIFSTYGLVQSKLRNRLGNDKAAKLVFIYKSFNR